MTKAAVYTQDGKKHGEVNLSEHLFTLPWSDALVHQVVTGMAHNRRAGTAHTKGSGDVRGGGRKPWRQKGTGRARHGSIRSPLWVGGGVTFGPDKNKKYGVALNKKMRTKAFFTVLSEKLRSGSVMFIDSFSLEKPSTKKALACIKPLCGEDKCTVVFAVNDDVARKSFANVPRITTTTLEVLNTRDIFTSRKIVFVDPEKTLAVLVGKGKNIEHVEESDIKGGAQAVNTKNQEEKAEPSSPQTQENSI